MDLLRQCYESSSGSDDDDDDDNNNEANDLNEHSNAAAATTKRRVDDDNSNQRPSQTHKHGSSLLARCKRTKVKVQRHSDKATAASAATATSSLLVRSVPHIRGNWAGHVFLPIQLDEIAARPVIEKSIQQFQQLLHQNDNDATATAATVIRHDELHISLSRTFYLQLGSIDSFVQDLRSRVAFEHETSVWLNVGGVGEVLVNDEQTRSFWTIPLQQSSALLLLRLVEQVNHVLRKFQQPAYYDPPIFHVSLASCPGHVTTKDIMRNVVTCGGARSEMEAKQNHTVRPQAHVVVDGMEDQNSGTHSGDDDDEEDEDDDDDLPCLIRAHVTDIHCTFGTTKTFVIPLVKTR